MTTLDPNICYQALRSRDARFDGRFFTAVHTTGIYCRPVCPARTPKRANVTFYPSAAAAEADGFRPCMRCRPETSPGTPAWSGTAASVTRALHLIDEGFLDDRSVDDLAATLGMTSRHLRRLFDEHLGASPVAIAQARRVHFARRLVGETGLPITEIAFGAGFASVRRFNAVFQRTFGRPPSAFRRERVASRSGEGGLELSLPARPPFDAHQVIEFIAPRAMPGVERVEPLSEGLSYRRMARFGRDNGVIAITVRPRRGREKSRDTDDGAQSPRGADLELQLPASLAVHAHAAVERSRQLFDLKSDPLSIGEHLSRDPMLRGLAARYPGVRIPGAWSPFETAVRAVLGQQVSVAGATTVAGRIVDRYGERLDGSDGPVSRLFPDPGRLVRARLEALGLTKARARAIRSLARAAAAGALEAGAGLDDILDRLQAIDGIGPWTAHYMAMRIFGEPDAFPSGDLALRRAAQALDPNLDSEKKLIARAEAWRPWRAYATMLLWRWYAGQGQGAGRSRRPSKQKEKRS